MVTLEDEAIIYTGLELNHADDDSSDPPEDDKKEKKPTAQELFDALTPEQKAAAKEVVEASKIEPKKEVAHSDEESESKLAHDETENKEGRRMSRNVFESQNRKGEEKPVLTHDAIQGIVANAKKMGSLKHAVEDYALEHGIDNIDLLFPDARAITSTPEFDARRMEWVSSVINGTKHSPFSRIKSIVADITVDEARALGYVKGSLKKEEFFGLVKRTTTPTTVYKKQQLDRDDIVDITDFDVVTWLKSEMRLMLDEELARAVLIGDGRTAGPDKIIDPAGAQDAAGIRSILHDDPLYAAPVNVTLSDANSSPSEVIDALITNMGLYKGSGSPTFYTTMPFITSLLLLKDTTGRRLYNSKAELANAMGLNDIVYVEVMEQEANLLGIVVNLKDYTVGADKGGEVNFFDDFDIDYNQYKYLYETRLSGALTKIRSALVVKKN
jgi:hypothetical protein